MIHEIRILVNFARQYLLDMRGMINTIQEIQVDDNFTI